MELLAWLLPVFVGGLTTVLMQVFKKANAFVDGLPAFVKQVIVVALAFVASKGTALLGVSLPAGIFGIDAVTLNAALSALVAFAMHKLHIGTKPAA